MDKKDNSKKPYFANMAAKVLNEFDIFKKKILYENRFFNADDTFLNNLKTQIYLDQQTKIKRISSIVSPGTHFYRAREFDSYIGSNEDLKTFKGFLHAIEFNQCKCENLEQRNNEYMQIKQRSANRIRKIQEENKDCENLFNGYGLKDSFLPGLEHVDKISDMRANPKYISYLYTAGDEYTAIIETRPIINSRVSVAKIEACETLHLFDITRCWETKHDLSMENFELEQIISCLNDVFSTPCSGEVKDYLPAQIISEYIKCCDLPVKYDGICFTSSLNPKGKNYTIFNYEKCKPISSEVYSVGDISLVAHGITTENKVILTKKNPSDTPHPQKHPPKQK